MLRRLLDLTSASTVIDVGVGSGASAKLLVERDYQVTGVSLSKSPFRKKGYKHVRKDFEKTDLTADIVWCSHTLEHVQNVGSFLEKIKDTLNKDGWLCIVVPSDPTDLLIDGHLSFWTPAHLIYNLVVAGFDCSDARYYTEGRDIALMVQKKLRKKVKLNHDKGDYELLKDYFPVDMIPRETNPWLEDNFEDSNSSKRRNTIEIPRQV